MQATHYGAADASLIVFYIHTRRGSEHGVWTKALGRNSTVWFSGLPAPLHGYVAFLTVGSSIIPGLRTSDRLFHEFSSNSHHHVHLHAHLHAHFYL